MRHMFTALLAALMAAALAACGGGDAVALDPVAEAATKTSAAKSMRLEMRMTMSAPEFGSNPVAVTIRGVAEGERSAMTIRMPAVEGFELGNIEARSDGLVMYMRMPFLQQLAPQMKPWIKLDLREAGKELGVDFDAIMELSRQTDPTQALTYLRAAGEVEELGEAAVRGVQTTHYRAVIDLDRYASQLEDESKAMADAIRKVAELTGQSTIPMELWIDEDSLVRRMSWEQQVPIDAGNPSEVKMTMDLFDYGADVEVVIPPDDQTTTLEELEKLGEAG